jgi:hypothetical protein
MADGKGIEVAEMGIGDIKGATGLRATVESEFACVPINSWVMICQPIDADDHLLGFA